MKIINTANTYSSKSQTERLKKMKKVMESTDVKRLNMEIPTKLHDSLYLKARKEKRPATHIVRDLIESYIKK